MLHFLSDVLAADEQHMVAAVQYTIGKEHPALRQEEVPVLLVLLVLTCAPLPAPPSYRS